jgi:DNA-binding MarR family transcriptional regulator
MSIAKTAKPRTPLRGHEAALKKADEELTALARFLRVDGDRASALTGLSLPMALALGRLKSLPDQTTVSELARSLECNMGNLSGTLDRLQEAGYVERVVGETDRRARLIRLTAKGRRTVSQLSENFRGGRVCSALKKMNVRHLEAVTEMLRRLNDSVKADASS